MIHDVGSERRKQGGEDGYGRSFHYDNDYDNINEFLYHETTIMQKDAVKSNVLNTAF